MMISSGSTVRGWMLALALGSIAPLGCASNKASTKNSGTTPATQKNANPAATSQDTKAGDPAPVAPASAQEEALVRVKDKMFPPVDVGPWLCEPKSWNEKGQVLLHCTAPAGTTGVVAALKDDPAIAEATEAPK